MLRRTSALLAALALATACGGDDGEGDGAATDALPDVQRDASEAPDADETDTDERDTADAGETDAGETDAGGTDAEETDAGETDAGETDADETDADETDADGTDANEPDVDEPDSSDVGHDSDTETCATAGRVLFDEPLSLWTRVGDPLPIETVVGEVVALPCGAIRVLSDVSWLSAEWTGDSLALALLETPPAGLESVRLVLIDDGAERIAGSLDITWRALPQAVPEMVPHVLWIGIDGMRSDALYAANTPTMDRLRDGGAWTYDGSTHRSTATDSAAGWTTLFTGVDSDKHLVLNNGTLVARDWDWPTVAQMVRDDGRDTAVYAHWTPITSDIHEVSAMSRRGNGADDAIRDQAVAELQRGTPGGESGAPPSLLLLHLDDVDHAGHGSGFTSLNPNYIAEIEAQDARIAVVVDALLDRDTLESEDWMVFVVTDHGGEGTSHGARNLPNWRIPFLQWGTSVAPGRFDELITHMDVVPTVLAHLGIASDLAFDGRSVSAVARTANAVPTVVETTCDDRIDEDGDRLFDCNDPDCNEDARCAPVCADREALASSGVIASGDNSEETTDYGLTCARLPGGRDVGVSFVAPTSGMYRFDTTGTSFDTILAVYAGVCPRPSDQLDCDDDGGDGLLSQIDVALVAGQAVTVVVAGFDGASGAWTLNASVVE